MHTTTAYATKPNGSKLTLYQAHATLVYVKIKYRDSTN